MTASEPDWVAKIGKPALDSIREMVAALECDYERLQELRDERDGFIPDDAEEGQDEARDGEPSWAELWAKEYPDDAEELADLEDAAGDCESQDDARERIQEDPLSVEVRSGWVLPGADMEAEDFCILLSTGGPAVRIRGELADGEPHRAWLEVQDWGKPWTEHYESGAADVLLAYSRCFCFDC